jgi:predicted branched-subunit amino acid permease
VLTGSLPRRLLAAQLVLDESTAMATAQRERADQRTAFWVTGGTIYVLWNLGTLLGALAGTAIDPETFGLDAAFPAAYLAMVVPHLRHRTGLLAGITGAVICLGLIPFTPVGVPILCASAAILLGIPRPGRATDSPIDEGTAGVP